MTATDGTRAGDSAGPRVNRVGEGTLRSDGVKKRFGFEMRGAAGSSGGMLDLPMP